jgi:hypothetical protein
LKIKRQQGKDGSNMVECGDEGVDISMYGSRDLADKVLSCLLADSPSSLDALATSLVACKCVDAICMVASRHEYRTALAKAGASQVLIDYSEAGKSDLSGETRENSRKNDKKAPATATVGMVSILDTATVAQCVSETEIAIALVRMVISVHPASFGFATAIAIAIRAVRLLGECQLILFLFVSSLL